MTRPLQIRRGRALAVAILLVLAALLAWPAGAVLLSYAAGAGSIAESQRVLARLAAVAAQAEPVERWAAALAANVGEGAFLAGESPSLVAAELQSRVSAIAAENGAMVTSFRALEPQAKDQIIELAVEVDLYGTLGSLRASLQQIESAPPLLFVERAFFRAEQRGGDAVGEPMLNLQLEVHGFLAGPGPEPEA